MHLSAMKPQRPSETVAAPTHDEVLDAFDACGGSVVQPMVLRFTLEKRGFDAEAAVSAINTAVADGVLGRTPAGGVFLTTKLES